MRQWTTEERLETEPAKMTRRQLEFEYGIAHVLATDNIAENKQLRREVVMWRKLARTAFELLDLKT